MSAEARRPGRVPRSRRSLRAARPGGRADHHPCRDHLPGGRARLQDEAPGALQLPRLLDRRQAPAGARGRAQAQPADRADALPSPGGGDASGGRWLRVRGRRAGGRMAARDGALRSGGAARSDRRAAARSTPRRSTPWPRRSPASTIRPRCGKQRGGYPGMREVIDGNAADLAGLAAGVFERAAVAELDRRTAAELEAAPASSSSKGAPPARCGTATAISTSATS